MLQQWNGQARFSVLLNQASEVGEDPHEGRCADHFVQRPSARCIQAMRRGVP